MTKKTLDTAANHPPRRKMPSVLIACGLAITAGSIRAADSKLTPDGSLHTVSVTPRTGPGVSGGGTKIVDRILKLDGSVEVKVVPGTDDWVVEADPSLTVSPVTGLPVLVFTRLDEPDTEVFFAMYDGTRWSDPQFLTADDRSDRKPLIAAGRSGNLHVMWETLTGTQSHSTFYQAVFDRTGAIVLPPIACSLPPETPSESAAPGILGSDILFAFVVAPPSEKQTIICFGGSDDPIPVRHRLEFGLSQSAAPVDHVKIERVGTQLVVLAHQSRSLLYAVGSQAGWTPFSTISLDSISEEKAELLIKELIARGAPR